jgi:hypothetical protein
MATMGNVLDLSTESLAICLIVLVCIVVLAVFWFIRVAQREL